MHILVIGATGDQPYPYLWGWHAIVHFANIIQPPGQSGIDFAREALKQKHTLTLYIRSPGKLPQDIKDDAKVTVVQGGFDAEFETIRPAITNGAEAIVSTAGPIASNNGNGTVSCPPLIPWVNWDPSM
jgi:putative NADH-flavin reductase